MPEKIYACLLRLFPPAFRSRYRDESLGLLRDRLRDEKGVLRRLRLSFDLLADLLGALPQAWKNAYPSAAPAPGLDGAPPFQILRREPMRRAALVGGSLVSLTAVAAFIYVMQGPVAFHPARRKGHPSPIALVMEHLNKPVSDDLPSDASRLAANASTATPPDRTANAGVSARAVEAASTSASRQPTVIRVHTPSGTAIPATSAPEAGWSGSWRAVNGEPDLPGWISLRQEGAKFTFVAARDSAAPYLLFHAQTSGDSISFELQDGRRTLLYDLKAEGAELSGTATITTPTETRTVAVRFEGAP